MNFDFSDEQKQMRDEARKFLAEKCPPKAVRVVLDEGVARPILIGRPEVIEMRIKKIGLNLKPGRDFEVVNPESDPRYRELWTEYYKLMGRDGVTPDLAKARIRRDTTLIGVMLLRRGDADALVCGTFGTYEYHLKQVADPRRER